MSKIYIRRDGKETPAKEGDYIIIVMNITNEVELPSQAHWDGKCWIYGWHCDERYQVPVPPVAWLEEIEKPSYQYKAECIAFNRPVAFYFDNEQMAPNFGTIELKVIDICPTALLISIKERISVAMRSEEYELKNLDHIKNPAHQEPKVREPYPESDQTVEE